MNPNSKHKKGFGYENLEETSSGLMPIPANALNTIPPEQNLLQAKKGRRRSTSVNQKGRSSIAHFIFNCENLNKISEEEGRQDTCQISMKNFRKNTGIEIFRSMAEVMTTKNHSIKKNDEKNQRIFQFLQEKIEEVNNIFRDLKEVPELMDVNQIKFALISTLQLLETLKFRPNVDTQLLKSFSKQFKQVSKKLNSKFCEIESLRILQDYFRKILKCLNNYIVENSTNSIILRVGSLEDLEESPRKKKKSGSNPLVEEESSNFEKRTRVMKYGNYANLKVQTNDLEKFRYIKKKVENSEEKQNEEDDCCENFNRHCDNFLNGALVFCIIMMAFFLLGAVIFGERRKEK